MQKESDTSKYVKKKITLKDAQHILAKMIELNRSINNIYLKPLLPEK